MTYWLTKCELLTVVEFPTFQVFTEGGVTGVPGEPAVLTVVWDSKGGRETAPPARLSARHLPADAPVLGQDAN